MSEAIATCNLKANFLETIFILFHIMMVKLLLSIFILSSIAHASLGHARRKRSYGSQSVFS